VHLKEKLLGSEDADVATSLGNIANVLAKLGRISEALEISERALSENISMRLRMVTVVQTRSMAALVRELRVVRKESLAAAVAEQYLSVVLDGISTRRRQPKKP